MPSSGPSRLLNNNPLKILIAAWLLAGLIVTTLIVGEQFFPRFESIFGAKLVKYSTLMSNAVREESASKPVKR
jgi:hypothetical protein